jgi:hypothetical protein
VGLPPWTDGIVNPVRPPVAYTFTGLISSNTFVAERTSSLLA